MRKPGLGRAGGMFSFFLSFFLSFFFDCSSITVVCIFSPAPPLHPRQTHPTHLQGGFVGEMFLKKMTELGYGKRGSCGASAGRIYSNSNVPAFKAVTFLWKGQTVHCLSDFPTKSQRLFNSQHGPTLTKI